jgi:cytochrome c oxidase assembly protein subunit 11
MRNRNRFLALNLLALAAGMLLLAYASVPLYRLFCEMTGYGGTTRQAIGAPVAASERTITVRFNADIDQSLPWEFRPLQKSMTVRLGEQVLAHYEARNLLNKPVSGHAVYNVVPFAAGPYFGKIECFCFTQQTLAPHARVDMPVSFYIDPAILDDPDLRNVKTITLSYTFFAINTGSDKTN